MKTITLFLAIIIASSILLTGCETESTKYICPDGKTATEKSGCSFCGDGICKYPENKCTCETDCGSCVATPSTNCIKYNCDGTSCVSQEMFNCCGNGLCETEEIGKCSSDCKSIPTTGKVIRKPETYSERLTITTAQYDEGTDQLIIKIYNPSEKDIFFQGEYIVTSRNHNRHLRDSRPLYVSPYATKRMVYDTSLYDPAELQILLDYGPTESLGYFLQKDLEVDFFGSNDRSDMELYNIKYDRSDEEFRVRVRNNGNADGYAYVEIRRERRDDYVSVMSTDTERIESGEYYTFVISDDRDYYVDNVVVRLYYGDDEDNLKRYTDEDMDI